MNYEYALFFLHHERNWRLQRYAFETSPYPVILTIENHVGLVQQRVMADVFQEVYFVFLVIFFSSEKSLNLHKSWPAIHLEASFFQVLGDLLYLPHPRSAQLEFPSPNVLKKKILLRGKKLGESNDVPDDIEEDDSPTKPKVGSTNPLTSYFCSFLLYMSVALCSLCKRLFSGSSCKCSSRPSIFSPNLGSLREAVTKHPRWHQETLVFVKDTLEF